MKGNTSSLRRSAALFLGWALLAGLLAPIPAKAADQLADTPWPTYMGDRNHTGQSEFLGPLFPSGAPSTADVKMLGAGDKFRTSLAIGTDGTIYAGNGWFFCAAKPDMSAWKFPLRDTVTLPVGDTPGCTRLRADISSSSPAIAMVPCAPASATCRNGLEETMYLGDRDNTLTAFRTDGTVKWRYNHGFEGDIWTSPVIGTDGTIYEVHSLNIYGSGVVTAVNPDGTEQWHYVLGVIVGTSSPALDTNGILYVGDNYGQLHAFCTRTTPGCSAGTRLWRLQVGQVLSAAPTIGPDRSLYVGTSGGVVALTPTNPSCVPAAPPAPNPCTPTQKWKFSTPGYVYQTAALSQNGTLYFGATVSNWNMFYAVDAASGALKWSYGPLSAPAAAGIMPVVGADGTVYLAVGAVVFALRGSDGQLLWKFSTFNQILSSPIIGGNATPTTPGQATLYVGSSDKFLYAITSPRGTIGQTNPPVANAGGDLSNIKVGQAVNFHGSAGNGSPPLSYTWNFGDGTSASGQNVTHTYWSPSPAGSPYAVVLTVSGPLATSQDTALVQVVPSGNGAFTCSDTFTRANGPTLGAPDNGLNPTGTTCPPVSWSEAPPASSLSIVSGEMRNDAVKGVHVAFLQGLVAASQNVSAEFASIDNNSAPRFGVVLRYQDAGNYYLIARQAGSTNYISISKVVAGVETVLAWRNTANAPLNAFFRLGGTINGNAISLQIEGTTWLTATDATFGGGSAGIYLNTGVNASSYRVDDFIASGQ